MEDRGWKYTRMKGQIAEIWWKSTHNLTCKTSLEPPLVTKTTKHITCISVVYKLHKQPHQMFFALCQRAGASFPCTVNLPCHTKVPYHISNFRWWTFKLAKWWNIIPLSYTTQNWVVHVIIYFVFSTSRRLNQEKLWMQNAFNGSQTCANILVWDILFCVVFAPHNGRGLLQKGRV
jgi:hypothetical protein